MGRRKKHKHMSEVKHLVLDEDGKVISEEIISKTALIKGKYDKIRPYSQQRFKQSKERAAIQKHNHINPNNTERKFYDVLIECLKKHQGFIKYPKTQVPIFWCKAHYYILDIYFDDKKLAIEIDGKQHVKEKDDKRDKRILERHGIVTWRYPAWKCWKYPYKTAIEVIKRIEDM